MDAINKHMLDVCWSSLNVQSYINPRFVQIAPSKDDLAAQYDAAGFTFCPGLLETLQSPTAPPPEFLKSLSNDIPINVWGIYVLVLKKPGQLPRVYVGSGTAVYRGARSRLADYDRGVLVPRYVAKSLEQGFEYTKKAMLAYCPIPPPRDIPCRCTTVLVLEAVFAGLFWAMHSKKSSYGLDHICQWPLDSVEWTGLCSHNPLMEGIRTGEVDFDFTPEQLEEMAAATKAKNRAYQDVYHKNLRANPTPQFLETHRRANVLQRPKTRQNQIAAVANKTYYCAACDVACRDNATLVRHNKSPRHHKKLAMGNADYLCDLCNISFRFLSNFNRHKECKGHIDRANAKAKVDNSY